MYIHTCWALGVLGLDNEYHKTTTSRRAVVLRCLLLLSFVVFPSFALHWREHIYIVVLSLCSFPSPYSPSCQTTKEELGAPRACPRAARRGPPASAAWGNELQIMAARAGTANNIRVAVRVRPLNEREKQSGGDVCVSVVDNTVLLKNPGGDTRSFTFDHSYWSADASAENYASQQKVFDDLGCVSGKQDTEVNDHFYFFVKLFLFSLDRQIKL